MIMPMQLIERPGDHDGLEPRHHGLGALLSAALHTAAAAILVAAMQFAVPDDRSRSQDQVLAAKLIWFPSVDLGGGQIGGARSSAPARRARIAGTDSASVPALPQPSTAVTTDIPTEIVAVPAKPMADATQAFPGAVASDSTTNALGRGVDGIGGDNVGPPRGSGTGPDGFGNGVRRGGPGVTMPELIERVPPRYTADAMRARVQGSVWLECVVLPDGTVGEVRVTRSLDPILGLDQEAIAAARRWRFRPGRVNGLPVPVAVSIELTFNVR
jgi:TonB family protein